MVLKVFAGIADLAGDVLGKFFPGADLLGDFASQALEGIRLGKQSKQALSALSDAVENGIIPEQDAQGFIQLVRELQNSDDADTLDTIADLIDDMVAGDVAYTGGRDFIAAVQAEAGNGGFGDFVVGLLGTASSALEGGGIGQGGGGDLQALAGLFGGGQGGGEGNVASLFNQQGSLFGNDSEETSLNIGALAGTNGGRQSPLFGATSSFSGVELDA